MALRAPRVKELASRLPVPPPARAAILRPDPTGTAGPGSRRAALYWLAWTDIVDRDPELSLVVQVETLSMRWDELMHRLSLSCKPFPPLSKDIGNTQGAERISLSELDAELAERVMKKAAQYGYSL